MTEQDKLDLVLDHQKEMFELLGKYIEGLNWRLVQRRLDDLDKTQAEWRRIMEGRYAELKGRVDHAGQEFKLLMRRVDKLEAKDES